MSDAAVIYVEDCKFFGIDMRYDGQDDRCHGNESVHTLDTRVLSDNKFIFFPTCSNLEKIRGHGL